MQRLYWCTEEVAASVDFERHVQPDGSIRTRSRPVWLEEGSRLVFVNTCATGGEDRYLLVMSDATPHPARVAVDVEAARIAICS